MTRRDYERAVLVINAAQYELLEEKQLIVDIFVNFFYGDNVLFNKERFKRACLNKNEQ